MMPVADHLLMPLIVLQVSVLFDPVGHLGIDRVPQKALHAVMDDLSQQIAAMK